VSAKPEEPGSVPDPKVFISYRREETAAYAGRLYDAMVSRFGEDNVFMDVNMAPGIDFVERITEVIAACQVLIVVIGPTWATVEDERGKARMADPEDFVRLEVQTALRRPDVTPIPVLVSGARMPKREDLPPEIQAITRRNALELSHERWRYDMGRLIKTLDELLADAAQVSGPSTLERGVSSKEAASPEVAQAPEQSTPSANTAATERIKTKQAAPSAGVPARLRGRLAATFAIAIAVVAGIAAALVLMLGGGSSDQPGSGALKVTAISSQPVGRANGTVSCPPSVRFVGFISAQGSGEVKYRWHAPDGTNKDGSVRFDRSGQKTVETAYRAKVTDGKAKGTMLFGILSPLDAPGYYAASFDYTCASP
jgi:TIR domain